jgi:EAL and modified HD-GYP domain-containing signal transduction protein
VELYLARQPIFDRQMEVHAYELLYRSSATAGMNGVDDTTATMQVLSNSLTAFGLERVAQGKPCFINLGRELLVGGSEWLKPANLFVVEVLETVPRDEPVQAACKRLKTEGYQLALDDFIAENAEDPLIGLANVIKVDFRGQSQEDLEQLTERLQKHKVKLLAEKVETRREYEWARKAGYDYFQGYFFAKPDLLHAKEVSGFKLNYLRILREAHRQEIDLEALEELLKREAGLCQRLLRYVNSAAFHFSNRVLAVRQALNLLGQNEIRRWTTLAVLPGLAMDKPSELAMSAMLRAHFCELLAGTAGFPGRKDEMFLVGMFSHLDAMLDKPLEEILADFPLNDDIRDALLRRPARENSLSELFEMALYYEAADWNELDRTLGWGKVNRQSIAEAYVKSVDWALEAFRAC